MWNYININCVDEVIKLREMCNMKYSEWSDEDFTSIQDSVFITNQEIPFKIYDDIFGKVTISILDNDSKEGNCSKTEKIQLCIYSYKKSCNEIRNFIIDITNKYNRKIEKIKNNKKFIYTLKKINEDEDLIWYENEFTSNRTFDNMFFDNKEDILSEINFFNNNKKWFVENGEPYNLGIGLKGEPGTGKTTFIKSLANLLDRHLIVIPLNRIDSEESFFKAFFEKKYVKTNKNNIDFSDKIIVFEDIDCMDDIVISRDNKNKDNHDNNNNNNIQEAISNLMAQASVTSNYEGTSPVSTVRNVNKFTKKKITLSFILNILDGLIETNGRIIVISSNFYDDLDSALTRPGRIDLCLDLKKCSVNTLNNIYNHFYKKKLTKKQLQELKGDIITPCNVINIKKKSKNEKDFFENICRYIKNNS